MAIKHLDFNERRDAPTAPSFMKGAGYTDRCAECGHFFEEHAKPRSFCRCCNAGPQPLPAKDGVALGFRSRTDFVEGAAGTIQGAEYPKHLMKYGTSGEVVTTVVQDPDAEKRARDAGFAGSIRELGPNPVAKARAADTLEARMQRQAEIEEILSGEAQEGEVPRETLERVINQRNGYAQELANITQSLNAPAKPGEKK